MIVSPSNQTFKQPQQSAPAARDSDACSPGHPTCPAELYGIQRTAVAIQSVANLSLFVDDQQAGPSRPLTIILIPTNHFNPAPVASATEKESQHKISGLSRFFGNIPSVLSYQQINALQPYSPANTQPPAASPPIITASQQEHYQPPAHSQPQCPSQSTPNSSSSRTTAIASNWPLSGPLV